MTMIITHTTIFKMYPFLTDRQTTKHNVNLISILTKWIYKSSNKYFILYRIFVRTYWGGGDPFIHNHVYMGNYKL